MWTDLSASPPLRDQFEAQGIAYETTGLPWIVGMGGNAYLVHHVSPHTGEPVTVPCVPYRTDIDSFSEDYYYFEGVTVEEARATGMD